MLISCTTRKREYNYSSLLFSFWLEHSFWREASGGPDCLWEKREYHQQAQQSSLQAGRLDRCHSWCDSPSLRKLRKRKLHIDIPLQVANILIMLVCQGDWKNKKTEAKQLNESFSIKAAWQIWFIAFYRILKGFSRFPLKIIMRNCSECAYYFIDYYNFSYYLLKTKSPMSSRKGYFYRQHAYSALGCLIRSQWGRAQNLGGWSRWSHGWWPLRFGTGKLWQKVT